jgi:hypothetical protein
MAVPTLAIARIGGPARDALVVRLRRSCFESDADFDSVYGSAGLDLNSLRARLLRIGRKVEMNGSIKNSVAA